MTKGHGDDRIRLSTRFPDDEDDTIIEEGSSTKTQRGGPFDPEVEFLHSFLDTSWAEGYYYEDEMEECRDILGALSMQPDTNLIECGLNPAVIRNNYQVLDDMISPEQFAAMDETLTAQYDEDPGSIFDWLFEQMDDLLDRPVERSFIESLGAQEMVTCLELLARWLTKTDDELRAARVNRTVVEKNFHAFSEAWENFERN